MIFGSIFMILYFKTYWLECVIHRKGRMDPEYLFDICERSWELFPFLQSKLYPIYYLLFRSSAPTFFPALLLIILSFECIPITKSATMCRFLRLSYCSLLFGYPSSTYPCIWQSILQILYSINFYMVKLSII